MHVEADGRGGGGGGAGLGVGSGVVPPDSQPNEATVQSEAVSASPILAERSAIRAVRVRLAARLRRAV